MVITLHPLARRALHEMVHLGCTRTSAEYLADSLNARASDVRAALMPLVGHLLGLEDDRSFVLPSSLRGPAQAAGVSCTFDTQAPVPRRKVWTHGGGVFKDRALRTVLLDSAKGASLLVDVWQGPWARTIALTATLDAALRKE